MITLTSKDLFYAMGYIISLMGLIFWVKNQIYNIKKDNSLIQQVIFGEKGCLNLIDEKTCNMYRDQVFVAIRATESIAREVKDSLKGIDTKMQKIDNKMHEIMVYWKIQDNDSKKKQ